MSELSRRSSASFEPDYGNPQFLKLVEEIWPHLDDAQVAGHPADDSRITLPDPFKEDEDGAGLGVSIGRFEIRRELGRGGEGVVLLAFDPRLHRTVAMKVPGPEGLLSSRSRQRFLSEARAVAAMRHPNIVTIHEAGEAGPIPYFIMDYCEGGSLKDWLERRPSDQPVSPRWAARMVALIADGIQHAHDHGILHRDLKPSNILFQSPARDSSTKLDRPLSCNHDEPDSIPMVTDFGLARSMETTRVGLEKTLDGLPLGTLPYMSSEAARGDGAAIGCATDVYGLGVILFEWLTGQGPFQATSRAALLEQILEAEPPSPRSLRGDLPIALEEICLRCLQKNPSARYQRPGDLALELRRFLDSSASSNSNQGGAKSKSYWLNVSNLCVRSALVSLLIACAIGWAIVAIWRDRANRRPSIDGPSLQLESVEYEQLFQVDPDASVSIARLIHARTSDLPARLRREIERLSEQVSTTEARDRRRARAACVLIALDQGSEGWDLLRFGSDPQARSFLIHELGPAGIAPQKIVDRLGQETEPSIRRSLIQSLGQVADAAWTEGLRARTRSLLFNLYENDIDPGVHASSKWLLLRWNQVEELRRLDKKLAGAPRLPERRWRVSPMGLTLVTLHDPATGRDIEVADTEITLELFRKFREDHPCQPKCDVDPSQPVSSVNYILAAQFCNWLSQQEGIAAGELAYRSGRELPLQRVEEPPARTGYRLLTTREYELACRAGTRTTRYYGSSDSLLSYYAWHGTPYDLRMQPVARLKPNDFGLFDMLGNVDEICQGLRANRSLKDQAVVCGGSVLYEASSIRSDQKRGPISVTQDDPISWAFGFRVARTVGPPH